MPTFVLPMGTVQRAAAHSGKAHISGKQDGGNEHTGERKVPLTLVDLSVGMRASNGTATVGALVGTMRDEGDG